MQAPQPSISGTRDYAGDDAVALQTARDAIEATLRRYAYAPIDPPILESPLPFLNRSGEDIRRQMYIFPDPAGSEVCLRPELTIPVCRAYLRQLQIVGRRGAQAAAREARLSYFGPAFTYELASDGRLPAILSSRSRVHRRVIDAKSADAEILAAALDALEATGPQRDIGRNRRCRYSQCIHRPASSQRALEDAHSSHRAAQPERDALHLGGVPPKSGRCAKRRRVRRIGVASCFGGARQGRTADQGSVRSCGRAACRRTHA